MFSNRLYPYPEIRLNTLQNIKLYTSSDKSVAKAFFKKFFPHPDKIRQIDQMKWLGNFLHDPNLWHLNRYSVSGAFAVGLFIMYIPIPLQMLPAALLAIAFRVNMPIAVSLVWITNPLTIAPMYYLAYKIGALILGTSLQPFGFELSLDWLFLELGHRWRPFLLGCFILGAISGLTGFISVRLLWRLHLVQRLKKRRLKREKNKL